MTDTRTQLSLTINEQSYAVVVEHRTTLLSVLRDQLGLTGTKQGCYRGQCGACTVLLDGQPRLACLVLAMLTTGAVRTVEGLAPDGELCDLQKSFVDHHGFQCGFCTAGLLMSGTALLSDADHDGRALRADDVRQALRGHLCRCGNYPNIVASVLGGQHVVQHEQKWNGGPGDTGLEPR